MIKKKVSSCAFCLTVNPNPPKTADGTPYCRNCLLKRSVIQPMVTYEKQVRSRRKPRPPKPLTAEEKAKLDIVKNPFPRKQRPKIDAVPLDKSLEFYHHKEKLKQKE